MNLEKGQLGLGSFSYFKNIPVITSRPCPPLPRLRALSLRNQANNKLNTDDAISTRGLQLTFGGGGSRKQVKQKNSPPPLFRRRCHKLKNNNLILPSPPSFLQINS
jgi:hypothetical protein